MIYVKKKNVIIALCLIVVLLLFSAVLFEKTRNKLTVFYVSDNKIIKKEEIKKNNKIKKIDEPVLDGYKFLGWYNGDTLYSFSENVKDNMILFARYEAIEQVTITFDTDGGNEIDEIQITKGSKVTKPADPTKEGYLFKSWILNDEEYDFNKEVTDNITLKATWDVDLGNMLKVTFDTDGGSSISSLNIKENTNVSKPKNPTKKGYIFKDWTLDGKKYDFNTKLTSNITLKAIWEKGYTLVVNLNGGTAKNNAGTYADKAVIDLGTPTKTGYNFTGWTITGGRATLSGNKLTITASDVTVTANYEERPIVNYTVSFDTAGGSSINNAVVPEGNKVPKPNDPTKSGAVFNGWMLNGNSYDFNNIVTGNITLVANWKEIMYKVIATPVDDYSPDVILSVWNGNTQVTSYQSINYSDGVVMCNSANPTINKNDFASESSFIIVLTDGTRIRATK